MSEESDESSSSSSSSDSRSEGEDVEAPDVEAPASDDEAEPADPKAVVLEKEEAGADLYPEYPDDESEREQAVQTRTAIMKERAAKKAASTMSLSRSWTRRTSGKTDSPRSPRSPGRDWADGADTFSPKRIEK